MKEIYPALFNAGEIQKVLQNLLKEKVSIRDLTGILEVMGAHSYKNKDTDFLTEKVRLYLSRAICRKYRNDEGVITVLTISPEIEEIIKKEFKYNNFTIVFSEKEKIISKAIEEEIKILKDLRIKPVVLCSPGTRLAVRRFIEKFRPDLAVISQNEIAPEVKIHSVGEIKIGEEAFSEGEDIFYYIEEMIKDKDPLIRCEAIKSLAFTGIEEKRKKIFSYIETGLKDKDEKVRRETAGLIRKMSIKNF